MLATLAMILTTAVADAPPDREHVDDGRRTLLAADGRPLRGTKMVVAQGLPEATAWAGSEGAWREVRALGLNAVRLGWADPWYRSHGYNHWTVEEALPAIDAAVARARETGTTLVLNYQDVGAFEGGRRDFTLLREFWRAAARRYADEPLVVFELCNEPAFSQGPYFDPAFKEPMLEIYRQVRRDAPRRPVLMFSFNSVDHEMRRVVDHWRADLDWDMTSVAFHLYGGGGTTASVRRLLEAYPAVCTEWDYPGTHPYVQVLDGRALAGRNCEDLGVSWFDWSGWEDMSLAPVRERLLPDAKGNGWWWGDGEVERELPPLLNLSGRVRIVGGGAALEAEGGDVRLGGGDLWTLGRTPGGRYRVEAGGGRVLTGGEKAGDAASVIGADASWLSQKWRLEPVWGGGADEGWPAEAMRLRCEWTNLCLGRGEDGRVEMREGGDRSTLWRLEPAG